MTLLFNVITTLMSVVIFHQMEAAMVVAGSKERIVRDKEFEIKYEIVYTTNNTQDISAVDSDRDTDNMIFYSVDRRIYSWNKLDGNVQLAIEAGAKIQSFHHIGAEKFLIRETRSTYIVEKRGNKQKDSSTCTVQVPKFSNCIRRVINNSESWGPIAIDYSKPTEVYFARSSSVINKINLEDSMRMTQVWEGDSPHRISAMAFNKDFSALYFIDNDKPTAVSHLDLSTFDLAQVPFHAKVKIDQAVYVSKNTFLCLTEQSALILLDSNSGRYRHLSLRESSTVPCNHSECSRELEINSLASHTTKYGRLYVLDADSRILALDYSHIESLIHVYGVERPATVNALDDSKSSQGWMIGMISTLVLLVLGALVTVSYGWIKKRKAKRKRFVIVSRRWTRRDLSSEFVEVPDIEEGHPVPTEPEYNTAPTALKGDNLYKNRPLPPTPQPTENITQAPNIYDTTDDEPPYIEFLEHVDRPITIHALIHEPPRTPQRPKPVLREARTKIYQAKEETTNNESNLNPQSLSTPCSSNIELCANLIQEESDYCDNPCYIPDSEAAESVHDVYAADPDPPVNPNYQQHDQTSDEGERRKPSIFVTFTSKTEFKMYTGY